MNNNILSTFPGGSKSRVNKAGNNIRNQIATAEDVLVVEEWRAAHRAVLNTFQEGLRRRTKNTDIVVAQRHKRKSTIVGKLTRFPSMNLARMDDVAGFRLIFKNIEELYKFRQKFHAARFSHKRLNEIDKYDYIKHPKVTGYRGIHDIYEYDVNSEAGRSLKGLLVEIQYRTLIQHSWATAVEIIGFITENQPKFEQGDRRYIDAMLYASEILSRAHEKSKGTLAEIPDAELVKKFRTLDSELNLLSKLRGIKAVNKSATANRNTILIFSKAANLEIRNYRNATDALEDLFKLEKEMPANDIVLVKADKSEDIRLAFKNYFSDTADFLRLIEDGCRLLMPNHTTSASHPYAE